MVRRYDEPIDVQTRPGVPDDPEQPTAFVWRGRLYVVRGVLAHWYERRAWWRDTASLTLLGLRADGAVVAGAATAQGTVAARAAVSVLPGAGERQVWRVEAAAGRSSPVGVYELVHDPLPEEPSDPVPGALPDQRSGVRAASAPGGWRLASVDD